jgi:hypothetical protein
LLPVLSRKWNRSGKRTPATDEGDRRTSHQLPNQSHENPSAGFDDRTSATAANATDPTARNRHHTVDTCT